MRFDDLTTYFEQLEQARGRAKMFGLLGELFSKASAAETARIAYMLEARLEPAFSGIQIGMGERMVASAIAQAAGKFQQQVDKLYKKRGDLGLVAESLLPEKRSRLTVSKVHSTLVEIARVSGSGSTEKKVTLLARLIGSASPREARYIVRLAIGRLRLGVGATTIIEAVARAQPEGRQARAIIERAYNLCSDLGLVLKTLRERGLASLKRFKVRVGKPVRMMMAERLPSAEAIIKRLGRCAAESKLDGFRCQTHMSSRKVEIFSRNLERITDMFPDVAAAMRSQIKARSAILEGEAIALNEETGEFYPFQVTMQRKRKHKIEEMARDYPLVFVAFDLLYVDGKDHTGREYADRRKALEKLIKGNGRVRAVERIVTGTAEELQKFFDSQIERGLEGLIAKRLDSLYEAGARNYNWIKLKRAYGGELTDTVDAVVVGYLRGKGNRARLGIGALLAAAYDKQTDSFKTIGKIGSGLSETNWIKIRRLLDQASVSKKSPRVDSRLKPDVWVEPKYVVTALADEITRSPVHTCAMDEKGRGLALRFPRVVGFIREDKSPEDATTVKEIEEMYGMQKRHKTAA